jgi:hypothetical protein
MRSGLHCKSSAFLRDDKANVKIKRMVFAMQILMDFMVGVKKY